MKTLRPLITKLEYSEDLQTKLDKLFFDILIKPVLELIKKDTQMLTNSNDVLKEAINSGKIQFNSGKFTGNFNSKITKALQKIGATFNDKTKTFDIAINLLPFDIQSQIAISVSKFENLHKEAIDYYDRLNESEVNKKIDELELSKEFQNITGKVEKDFKDTIKKFIVDYKRSDTMNEVLSEEYATNMKLYIKNFFENEIIELRKSVLDNTFNGYRAESLIKNIESRYGVSQSKATFLARQETNLLVAKFRETRYKEVGVNSYKWRIRGYKTRPDHKRLDGKIFSWDNPPIVNTKTGERKHPGEDYNCYCTAIPLVEI